MTEAFKTDVINLVNGALTGKSCVALDGLDYHKLDKLAAEHGIVVLIYYGLISAGLDPDSPEGINLFVKACQYISVAEIQDEALGALLNEFKAHNIDHMPLKGAVLRNIYPEASMRTMSDIDILIKVEQYDRIKPVMQALGYTEECESDHEFIWKKGSVCVELHKRLIPSYNKDYYAYFGDGWDKALPKGDGLFSFSDEDELVYLLTHFAKHYRDGGIGIKHIADIKLFLDKKPELDKEYLEEQLRQLSLWEFYNNILDTIGVWFDGKQPTDVTKLITDTIFSSGAYGTAQAHSLSGALKSRKSGESKSRIKRVFNTVFLPYANMCLLFPSLKKCPVLLPFFWIWRIIYTALFKKGRLTKHYRTIKDLTPENINEYERRLHSVGLEYRFEEDD